MLSSNLTCNLSGLNITYKKTCNLSFFLYKLHVFCELHLFAEYYIHFCNYYMFGVSSAKWPWYRARKSRRTLQNKVRLKVLPEQLTLFVNTFVAFKNVSFDSFLLYCPDYCSEIHAFSYCSDEKYRYKP